MIMTPLDSDLALVAGRMDLSAITGKSILVTGASGMIGSAVCRLLLSSHANFSMYASGRDIHKLRKCFADYLSDPRLGLVEMDIIREIQSDTAFDYMIDCASPGNPSAFRTRPVDVIEANVCGVDNLLRYGVEHGLKRMLYVSSGEVYGEGDGRDFTEDYCGTVPLSDTRSCYPQSKRVAEVLCRSYAGQYGVDVVIARPCHVYGPNFSSGDDRAFAQFLRNASAGEDIILKSQGRQVRSWIYVADCAAALIYLLINGESPEAYNIAPAAVTESISGLARRIADIAGVGVRFDCDLSLNAGFITRGVLSSARLAALGWHESFSLTQGLTSTLNHLLRGVDAAAPESGLTDTVP